MGGVGGVGLVLVDPGGGDVVVSANVVGPAAHSVGPGVEGRNRRPGKHHEIGAAAHDEAGIIRLQGDDHTAAAALGDQIQAVIEELAENGEPGVMGADKPASGATLGMNREPSEDTTGAGPATATAAEFRTL